MKPRRISKTRFIFFSGILKSTKSIFEGFAESEKTSLASNFTKLVEQEICWLGRNRADTDFWKQIGLKIWIESRNCFLLHRRFLFQWNSRSAKFWMESLQCYHFDWDFLHRSLLGCHHKLWATEERLNSGLAQGRPRSNANEINATAQMCEISRLWLIKVGFFFIHIWLDVDR